MELRKIMQPDHVVRILDDGTVDNPGNMPHVRVPEAILGACWDEHGDPHVHFGHETEFVRRMDREGWEVFQGRVSHGVRLGPVIDDTYYIGGALEEIIRDRPGFWVRHPVDLFPPDGGEPVAAGWALLHREAE